MGGGKGWTEKEKLLTCKALFEAFKVAKHGNDQKSDYLALGGILGIYEFGF